MDMAAMPAQEFERRVRQAAALAIPRHLAQAIWLVDVCGTSYTAGAAETGVSTSEFARRVRRARGAILAHVTADDADFRQRG